MQTSVLLYLLLYPVYVKLFMNTQNSHMCMHTYIQASGDTVELTTCFHCVSVLALKQLTVI